MSNIVLSSVSLRLLPNNLSPYPRVVSLLIVIAIRHFNAPLLSLHMEYKLIVHLTESSSSSSDHSFIYLSIHPHSPFHAQSFLPIDFIGK